MTWGRFHDDGVLQRFAAISAIWRDVVGRHSQSRRPMTPGHGTSWD